MRPRDIACPGTAHLLVSAGRTDFEHAIDQRMDTIQDTADAERSMVGITRMYEGFVE